ncbi:hypothetical protein G3480_18650 [Thiorhodococcus mannitoliphagus]|uniref:Uncharacterized protein n=1 Tax=Thiorhodococcus mannitoliphagus TaxID=329406 RepID=A0A6P1DX84_9GAMM|nr:hypothetical protein [Thiorhodococcus mannitoliphagus]NEX22299.1 hypothetical protein [Thiorhodococcus mannitoliphagus]
MSLTEYVWTLGLAEALAVSLILCILLFVKWRRLKRQLDAVSDSSARVAALLSRDIEAIEASASSDAATCDLRAAYLRALASPFRCRQVHDEDAWKAVLETFHNCFDDLALESALPSPQSRETQNAAGLDAPGIESLQPEFDVHIDEHIETLIERYRLTRGSLDANHETMDDFEAKYQHLQDVNEGLRTTLDDFLPLHGNDKLREDLDEARRCGEAILKSASVAKRNFKLLAHQCEDLETYIRQLQTTIRGYRASVRELIVARDSYIEQANELSEKLELREKLVERLRHNYDLLRQEYDRLYGLTQ